MDKVLVIEDDLNLGTTLAGVLETQNFDVKYLSSGLEALAEFEKFQPDVVLLDVMLNEELDGFDIGRQIRGISNVPIVFTTSRDGNSDFVDGFSIGNTDYIRKPYRMMEVMVRVEKMLASRKKKEAFLLGNFSFFPGERSLRYHSDDIHLNNYESAVLNLLCENVGSFVTRAWIIREVWGELDPKLKEGSLNNIVYNLRRYLQKDDKVSLVTQVGLGVKLQLAEGNSFILKDKS